MRFRYVVFIGKPRIPLYWEYRRHLLPEPEALFTVLEQISNDSRYVDIARNRARSLVDQIRHPR